MVQILQGRRKYCKTLIQLELWMRPRTIDFRWGQIVSLTARQLGQHFGKSRFTVYCMALRAAKFRKISVCPFVKALRAAKTLKNLSLPILKRPAGGEDYRKSRFSLVGRHCGRQKPLYLNGFEHREYARNTSFEESHPTQ